MGMGPRRVDGGAEWLTDFRQPSAGKRLSLRSAWRTRADAAPHDLRSRAIGQIGQHITPALAGGSRRGRTLTGRAYLRVGGGSRGWGKEAPGEAERPRLLIPWRVTHRRRRATPRPDQAAARVPDEWGSVRPGWPTISRRSEVGALTVDRRDDQPGHHDRCRTQGGRAGPPGEAHAARRQGAHCVVSGWPGQPVRVVNTARNGGRSEGCSIRTGTRGSMGERRGEVRPRDGPIPFVPADDQSTEGRDGKSLKGGKKKARLVVAAPRYGVGGWEAVEPTGVDNNGPAADVAVPWPGRDRAWPAWAGPADRERPDDK